MEGTKKVQPKTDEQLAKDFFKDYENLCIKHEHRIVTNPAFQARDDGTWSLILQVSVGKLPKQN